MAIITKTSDKKVLIIDDLPGMRSQLQMSLASAGFEKLHVVSNIKEALQRIEENRYDVILSDYFLGDSTSGQQFLEYLRTKDLISRNTIFIMITAERTYENVVMAAECAPDDYLLKPFTAEQLMSRLDKLVERQKRFAVIDDAHDRKDWNGVLRECDRMLAAKDRYFIELCKIKAATLLKLNREQEAADIYREVLALRPLPWAKLGLARALAQAGDNAQSLQLAQALINENAQFMAAYDFLGGLLDRAGDKQEALQVLQQARTVSPGSMRRNREITTLAMDTGNHGLAEAVMSDVLKQHKYSPVREAHDYAILARAMSEQGKTGAALATIDEARGSFRDAVSDAVLAASECVAHHKAGNAAQAEAALSRAMAVDQAALPPAILASVADACFALGKEEQANAVIKQMVQNHPDDDAVYGKVRTVLAAAGKSDTEASAVIAQSAQEVIQINNEGVRKAQAGELEAAIALLCEAADRLPNNLRIVGNAALALALDLARNGVRPERMQACLRYRRVVADRAPEDPKLVQIDATLKKVRSAG
jgi:DNA-binding response OmpR family regulator/Flp pilus assembly protein TadD